MLRGQRHFITANIYFKFVDFPPFKIKNFAAFAIYLHVHFCQFRVQNPRMPCAHHNTEMVYSLKNFLCGRSRHWYQQEKSGIVAFLTFIYLNLKLDLYWCFFICVVDIDRESKKAPSSFSSPCFWFSVALRKRMAPVGQQEGADQGTNLYSLSHSHSSLQPCHKWILAYDLHTKIIIEFQEILFFLKILFTQLVYVPKRRYTPHISLSFMLGFLT